MTICLCRRAFGGCLWTQSGSWCALEINGSFRVELWKLEGAGGVFFHLTKFVVGDGSMIYFWHDMLCGGQSLKDACRSYLGSHVLRMVLW